MQCTCLQVLQDFCKEAAASKPTILEADLEHLQSLQQDPSVNARLTLALQFRISVKRLLHSCIWQYDPSQAEVFPT